MLRQSITQSFRPGGPLFRIIVGSCFGLLLGIAFLRYSPFLVFGALAAAAYIYFALKRPELALLGILIATSSIVFEEQLPLLPIGGASLNVPDILLLGSLGLVIFRWLTEAEFRIVRTPLDWPILIFVGATILSTLIAISQSSVVVEQARRGLRPMFYYLTFFVVTNLLRERRQLNLLINGLFLLATIVATGMVMQFLLGDSFAFLPGRVESLQTRGVVYDDITRILPPGWSIVLVSFVSIVCVLVLEKFRAIDFLKFLLCCLLGLALVTTFLRSYWAAIVVVLVLFAYLVRGRDRHRLVGGGLALTFLAAILLLVVLSAPNSQAARLLGASRDRLSTLGSSETFQGQDGSFNWRMIENGYAFSSIVSHPLMGLGVGAIYRPWDPRLDNSGLDFRGYIHNGYLWVLLQSGLIGFLPLMWLSIAFLIRGFTSWQSITDNRMKAIFLGLTLVYLTVLIAAVVNSTFVQWRWTPVIGIMIGINEVILRFRQHESTV